MRANTPPRNWLAPLEQLGLKLIDRAAKLFPNAADLAAAATLLPGHSKRTIALHPGSGSATKNWPIENWSALARRVMHDATVVIIGGEADTAALLQIGAGLRSVINQPLTVVAATLARCDHFVGHDSGISHIAAAVATPATLLFGPSNPAIWAPLGDHVRVIRPKTKRLTDISVDEVSGVLERDPLWSRRAQKTRDD